MCRRLDAGGRHREAAAGPLAGVAARRSPQRSATGSLPRAGNGEALDRSGRRSRNWIVCCSESVREHLVSDVPLGVWLSGGLDSSTILHYAAEASSSRLKTFSISFRGRSFDETRYTQRGGRCLRHRAHELDLNPEQDLPARNRELAYYSDEPNADAGALPVWFLSRLTKTSATVALSGEGADELFGGYLTYRANLLAGQASADCRPRALASDAQRLRDTGRFRTTRSASSTS